MITGSGEVIHIHVSIHLIVLTSIVPSRSASLPRTFTTRLTYPPTPPIISEFIISGLIIHNGKKMTCTAQLSSERSLEGSTVSAATGSGIQPDTYHIHSIALTRNILISSEWGSDRSLIREFDVVRRSGRE